MEIPFMCMLPVHFMPHFYAQLMLKDKLNSFGISRQMTSNDLLAGIKMMCVHALRIIQWLMVIINIMVVIANLIYKFRNNLHRRNSICLSC